jgi:hypothetical protein
MVQVDVHGRNTPRGVQGVSRGTAAARGRSLLVLCGALALLGVAGHGAAEAQVAPGVQAADSALLASRLQRVEPGSILRVQTFGAERFRGPLTRVDGGTLVLGDRAIPLVRVEAVWLRGRATRRGATIGALAAGGAGLAYSFLFASLLRTAGSDSGEMVTLVVGGTLLSAAGGAAVGGAIGAASPQWRRIHSIQDQPVRPPAGAAPIGTTAAGAETAATGRRFAAVEGALAHGRSSEDGGTDGGGGVRLALLSEYGPRGERGIVRGFAAFGPEIGYQALGATGARPELRFRSDCRPDGTCETIADTVMVRRDYGMLDAGGVLRVGVGNGAVETYGILGGGLHVRRVASHVLDESVSGGSLTGSHYIAGYSVGGGAQFRPWRLPLHVGVEARWRSNALSGQSDGIDEVFGYWTLGGTVKRAW